MTRTIDIFNENSETILSSWMQQQYLPHDDTDHRILDEDDKADFRAFFNSFKRLLSEEGAVTTPDSNFLPALEIIHRISTRGNRTGFPPRHSGEYIGGLRDSLFTALKEQIKESDELMLHTSVISRLFDDLHGMAIKNFFDQQDRIVTVQNGPAHGTAIPVLKVWEGILAVPVIGELDAAKAHQIIEDVLKHLAKQTSFTIVILDVSGVADVDSAVAGHLISASSAIRLMGGKCIISGIQPEIARSIVILDIDLSHIIIKQRLSNAIKTSFEMLGMRVVK